MTIQQAIEKAKESGYKGAFPGNEAYAGCIFSHLMNPLFWQSLGKAMGWYKGDLGRDEWEKQWHYFIDHLAEGKDAESFFKDLK